MKKILALIALASFTSPSFAALKVFTCEPEWAGLVHALGGDKVEYYSASTALQDVHQVQARPSLIAKYRQADLVVCTGAELEIGWLPALAEKANNPKVAPGAPGFFEASQHVRMLEVPSSVDRANGDVHPYGNPHIQTGPQNIAGIAKALAAKLAELDPENAAGYAKRYADFDVYWQKKLAALKARAAPLNGVAVISHHRTWVYLYDFLGVKEVTTLEPKPGVPPSGAQLEKVLALAKSQPVKAVVYSSYEDARASQWLSEHANIPAVQLPFSIDDSFPGAKDIVFGHCLYDELIDRLLKATGGAK